MDIALFLYLTHTLALLYDTLHRYARVNPIKQDENEHRMAYFSASGIDSMLIWAGIPVSKRKLARDGIVYLDMPKTGRMLHGIYEGPYPGIEKLYRAMDRFAKSRHFSLFPSQYEKYLTTPNSSEDSLHMKIEIHYAIL
jgi:effector-binding domain-containing protein